MLTEVNRTILEAASESPSEELAWDFFCECGRDECREHVTLTLDAYLALRAGNAAVLAHGRHASAVQRARRLSPEAQALRNQAQHQLDRGGAQPEADPTRAISTAMRPAGIEPATSRSGGARSIP